MVKVHVVLLRTQLNRDEQVGVLDTVETAAQEQVGEGSNVVEDRIWHTGGKQYC